MRRGVFRAHNEFKHRNFRLGRHEIFEWLTCCHEESATAIAKGYFNVEGKPMGVMCHGTVGLQHASMAIYNAFVARDPVYMISGRTSPTRESAPKSPIPILITRRWPEAWVYTEKVRSRIHKILVRRSVAPSNGLSAAKLRLLTSSRNPGSTEHERLRMQARREARARKREASRKGAAIK